MDPQALLALIQAHKWVPVAAILVGLLIRLLKSDTPLPTIPPKWRSFSALVAGPLVLQTLNAIAGGMSWQMAVFQGIQAGAAAIVGHEVIVEGMRNGREFFQPKSPEPPSDGKGGKQPYREPSVMVTNEAVAAEAKPPSTLRRAISLAHVALFGTVRQRAIGFAFAVLPIVIGISLGAMSGGCKDPNTAANVVNGILDVEQTACVLAQAELGTNEPAAVAAICKIQPDPSLVQQIVHLFAAHKKAGAEVARARPLQPCTGATK